VQQAAELREGITGRAASLLPTGGALQMCVGRPKLDSLVIPKIPVLFAREFRGQEFRLLWRGTRDGFRAARFHEKCDNHRDTLTVILDTDGNVFGGFTRCPGNRRPSAQEREDPRVSGRLGNFAAMRLGEVFSSQSLTRTVTVLGNGHWICG
jgi:hypothetical protein